MKKFDPKIFSNQPFCQKIEKPWGWEILWTKPGKPYTGKIIHILAGRRLSLQWHDQKEESMYLLTGQAKIIWENNQGEMIETAMEEGKGYSICLGQKHRLAGITDCDIVEVSTPEIGTTYRLADDYQRADETAEVRQSDNRGWKS
ncbi:MAG: hypothetical protein A2233_00045 [Candidatus Kerfeldbacteria bacterium RIFOXYA2_FULL_38_24]|uniref:Mannose-6-phosphate isomerase type II C-terminal domain-containing protein n=1 Tax=Candidatus Kerfeldbacteria bacterium RIFOXYB2_FULL_38_14 TaxID=1798547 RepID=A0A1G2BAD9_9BACT|nr:MAG: hypothetical protein A2233_00045 [Candidatus Kerfeldbacteria bacterium RIFOXYA2_FULL_38_24]OGY85985.1 MAG: hypothetical protein A2319_00250 [Candidatus Kerfeldbacteria bacterium RIFOXYB2_FULL_38_14]OGY90098.1 MAG: hypothetical protein A2458_03845 [Candidatus Kerfeldbacteria bacterium RIFOXYC2_FULL_38_9]